MKVSLLDYGAGNVRSVRNAILAAGYELETIETTEQIEAASILVFPGVGAYPTAMERIGPFREALIQYIQSNRPFLGICLGMQLLFESSTEAGVITAGLAVIPGHVVEFDATQVAVPHIGWNGRILHQDSPVMPASSSSSTTTTSCCSSDDAMEEMQHPVYFVHSYYAPITKDNQEWILTSTTYGSQRFISSVQKGNVVAMQFHPEKSGKTGLTLLKRFLESATNNTLGTAKPIPNNNIHRSDPPTTTQLTKRLVVALDVRSNDDGDLVVTKGDQYDVRERKNTESNPVRNLGKPVRLAQRYYNEGADEIAFLNITSFRQGVIEDMPMLAVLEAASETIFVPLTVGGGIRSYTDPNTGTTWSALEVASRYFRAGADKVSIGSDAVYAAEQYVETGSKESSIQSISQVYGAQAVVVSIDPKRVYVASPADAPKHVVVAVDHNNNNDDDNDNNKEKYCWWQCTVNGGRLGRDICAVTLAKAVQAMGAGEIMLNSIDMDGQGNGYDLDLMKVVSEAVSIPVIASSGAGKPEHIREVFATTKVQAALAAGMFHRQEVEIGHVKKYLREAGIPARVT